MPEPEFLDPVREHICTDHLSRRTEQAYVGWIRRFVHFRGMRHRKSLDAEHVQQFLSQLAAEEHVAASMQNQAFAALLFLYPRVLKQELGDIGDTARAARFGAAPDHLARDGGIVPPCSAPRRARPPSRPYRMPLMAL